MWPHEAEWPSQASSRELTLPPDASVRLSATGGTLVSWRLEEGGAAVSERDEDTLRTLLGGTFAGNDCPGPLGRDVVHDDPLFVTCSVVALYPS